MRVSCFCCQVMIAKAPEGSKLQKDRSPQLLQSHHSAMSGWGCPKCKTWNGVHRRKCETCRHPGGPPEAWAAKVRSANATGWSCGSYGCSYLNFHFRSTCKRCGGQRTGEPKEQQSTADPTANQLSTQPSPASPASIPSQASAVVAVKDNRDAIRTRLNSVEATINRLKPLADDPDVAQLMESKRQEAEQLRGQLREARPLKSQLKAAMDRKEAHSRKLMELKENDKSMLVVLADVRSNIAREAQAMDVTSKEVLALQERIRDEDAKCARDTVQDLHPQILKIRAALPAELRHSLEVLIAATQAAALPGGELDDGTDDSDVDMEKEREREGDQNLQIQMQAVLGQAKEQVPKDEATTPKADAKEPRTAVIELSPTQPYGPALRPVQKRKAPYEDPIPSGVAASSQASSPPAMVRRTSCSRASGSRTASPR